MRKRRFYLLLIAALVLIGVLVAVLSGSREPEYGGRKLSEWVEDYSPGNLSSLVQTKDASRKLAKEAIHRIGTNALPWLLEWIRYEPPLWRRKLDQIAETLGIYNRLR